ncbi:DUF1269 domain-containing protein [Metallumcola ferriviriculae]|uniref:DUF1269 domain-containing protein n=1 Tax=Metallumcola ferriviriculae TaxID=3039180 RepID=A0AAU0URT4_9FIRM|nr:DUF1269 domain-containing protein [Desulfitibacteraceae bacterium MK1]
MPKVLAVFKDQGSANEAVKALRNAGFDREISVLSKDENQQGNKNENNDTAMGMDSGAVGDGVTTGGVLGGLTGLAVGAGALVIPGLGPLIAAGPIAGLLSGAATGGVAGGLVDWGIPEEEGQQLEEDVRQGKTLVAVEANDRKKDEAVNLLRQFKGENIKVH